MIFLHQLLNLIFILQISHPPHNLPGCSRYVTNPAPDGKNKIDAIQTPDILFGFFNDKLVGKNKISNKTEIREETKLECIHRIINSA